MIARLRRLVVFAGASRARVTVSVVVGALTVICGAGLMAMAGYLISRAAERPAILSLTVAIVGVRFFGLARPVARYLERLASHDVALRALGRIRVRAYRSIEPLAPAQLEGYRRGDLLARMVADVDALQNLHLRVVGPPLAALLACAVSVGVAAGRAAARQAGARGELAAELVELLGAAPELVVNGAGEAELGRVRAADDKLVALSRRDAFAGGMADGLLVAVTGATVAGVLAVAVEASAAGRLDRVLIATLALLALATFDAVAPLSAAARELSATLAAGERVLELGEREVAVTDPGDPAPAPRWPFSMALEGVRARYPGAARPALEGFSLRLDPGRRLALVGASGAGKTTVANLLLRFLDPEAGRVTIDGRDLGEYRQADVRRAIAVAGQDSYLFSASIRENVRLAKPEASDAEIERALRLARIWPWIQRLPDGWHTQVGEDGRELSGGQRQRVAVARALLADAPILVLDEPTAHLDPATADGLIRDVCAAAGERSVLLITHRREGLDLVDDVIELEG
jgi:ABC-type transport system involved in cytochrome bd biosynthesis fused ATPase/permease subunit